jgi:hypothetical protein
VCSVTSAIKRKESSVGHLDKASGITEKKILVCTSTREHITIKFRRIRRVAEKTTISFVMSACLFARPRETARFPGEILL